MLLKIPPDRFHFYFNNHMSCIIWFKNPQDDKHSAIQNALEEFSMCHNYIICLRIKFLCEDHLKYFPNVKEDNVVLYLRDRRIIASFKVTELSQIPIIFNFFQVYHFDSIDVLI